MAGEAQFSYEQVQRAYDRIRTNVHRTPTFCSSSIDRMVGCNVHFKAELLQKTGSFKARGALNAVAKLKDETDVRHVVTHSSGNHGQALAYAAKRMNLKCTIVVPENAPKPKVDAIAAYGADIVQCKSTMAARVEAANRIVEECDAILVHPHDNFDVMAGQGTIAIELLEQVPQLDAIIVPIGGGGMISGIAAMAKHIKPDCKIFAAEPMEKRLERSLRAGHIICEDTSKLLNTVADGMRVAGVGERCFPVILSLCEKDVFSLTDQQIIDAMKLVYQRLKLAIEPSSATGVAALFDDSFQKHRFKDVGVVLCGGNVDLDQLPWIRK